MQKKPGLPKGWFIWLRIAAAGLLTLGGYLMPDGLAWLRILLHAIAFASLMLDIILRAVDYLRKGHIMSDPLLLFAAAFVMFFLKDGSGPAAMAAVFYRAAEALRVMLGGRLRARNHVARGLIPETAVVLRNGEELELPTKRVRIGDTVLVRQGDSIPLDGVVLEGESDISEARLTGKTKTVPVSQGDRVFAGSINGISVLMIRVTAAEEDSALNQLRRVAGRAREERSDNERRLERLGVFFTSGIIAAALLVVVVPLLFLQDADAGVWLGRAMAMLATGGTSALLFALSASYGRAAARLLRLGLAVTSHRAVDLLGSLGVVVVDKARLSSDDCSVVSCVTMPGADTATLNRCASIVYYHHDSIVSQSLRRYCGDVGCAPDRYKEIPGYGISASFSGQMIHAGSNAYLERMGIKTERTGANTLHVALDNSALGYYILSDSLRDEAAGLFAALRGQGLKTVLFSPDPKEKAQADAVIIGADVARGDMLSREKAAEINKLRENHPGVIAFVGGAGDESALRGADVGILCDGLRNPAGPEQCGAILMSSTPEVLPEALRCAKRGKRDILRNTLVGAALKCILPLFAAFGFLPIAPAVLAEGVVTVALTALAGQIAEERDDA